MSSKLPNGTISAIGPNGSSFITRMSRLRSVSTVGSKKLPLLPIRLPPVRILAPFCTASAMRPSMAGMLAHGGGAGEADLAHHRMRDEVFRNLAGNAEHKLHHARRQPGIGIGAHQRRTACRRLLGAFQDYRTSRRQGRGNLSHRLVD